MPNPIIETVPTFWSALSEIENATESAACRGASETNVPGLEGIVLPEIELPFPEQINQHVTGAETEAIRWAQRMRVVTSPPALERFRRTRPARLAARAYPDVGAETLQVTADWASWLFMFDDQGDEGSVGRRPGEWEARMVPFAAVLAGLPADDTWPPLAFALDDLLRRTEDGMPATWRLRFRRHIGEYLVTYTLEARNRARKAPFGVREYIQHRRDSGAMRMVFDLAEFATRTEIPAAWYDSREYEDLALAANDVVCWTNDIVSLPKETARGDTHNLPMVIHFAASDSLQQALDRTAEMTRARVRTYLGAEQVMRHLLEVSELDARTRRGVTACIDTFRSWMRGNSDWSAETARYHEIHLGEPGAEPDYIETILDPAQPEQAPVSAHWSPDQPRSSTAEPRPWLAGPTGLGTAAARLYGS